MRHVSACESSTSSNSWLNLLGRGCEGEEKEGRTACLGRSGTEVCSGVGVHGAHTQLQLQLPKLAGDIAQGTIGVQGQVTGA